MRWYQETVAACEGETALVARHGKLPGVLDSVTPTG
jgi:hypothetical protein